MLFSRRRVVSIAIFALAIMAAFMLIYDNTDRTSRSFLAGNESEAYMVATSSPGFFMSLINQYNRVNMKAKTDLWQMKEATKNICLKDPTSSTKTPKEQLENFIEGDCAPIIMVPGLMATKLMLQIDCELLMKEHPEIMESCGWSTCSWSIWRRRPSPEYLLWIPGIFSPMSVISWTNVTCFGNLIRFEYNRSAETIPDKYQAPKGINVTWYGNTPGTLSDSDSGFNAVMDLLPLPFQTSTTRDFSYMVSYLLSMGYQKGLSMFTIPFDFRLTHLANQASYSLERTIRYAYALTGKKVVIVAHSLGNLNTLAVLNRMSIQDKEKMIAMYTSIAAPFAGAAKTIRLVMGGESAFLSSWGVGIDFYSQQHVISASSSTQDLLPSNVFNQFRNEPWMAELLKRIELDKKYPGNTTEGAEFWKNAKTEDIPYSFFPTPSNICFEGFSDRPKECIVGISDLSLEPVAVINGTEYFSTEEDIKKIIDEHYTMGDKEVFREMMLDALASNVTYFINPQVPTVLVYGSHLATEIRNEWDYRPEDKTATGYFAFPTRTIQRYGDGTVEVSFSLTIGLKWAWERLNNASELDAKAIKIVEYCSSYGQNGSIWDGSDEQGAKFMSNTSYVGLGCQCLASIPTEGVDCFHSGMINDPFVLDLVGEIALTNETVVNKQVTKGFTLSNDDLVLLQKTVPYIRNSESDQDIDDWFTLEKLTPKLTNSKYVLVYE